MTNALKVAAAFLARLPRDRLAPEATDGREGFVHPFDISGGVAEVKMKMLLRDFDAGQLAVQAELLRKTAAEVMENFPAAKIDVNIEETISQHGRRFAPRTASGGLCRRGVAPAGRTAKRTIVRGGTDGSRLTELGLPTPNLSCGDHNPHSPLEWACLDEMGESVEWLLSLVQVWGEGRADTRVRRVTPQS